MTDAKRNLGCHQNYIWWNENESTKMQKVYLEATLEGFSVTNTEEDSQKAMTRFQSLWRKDAWKSVEPGWEAELETEG
ncbi:hypothetical protein Tco_0527993 [Tanacetum coccineum]